jgi:hypothetical protein
VNATIKTITNEGKISTNILKRSISYVNLVKLVQDHGFKMKIDVPWGCGAATARIARERAMMVFTNIIVIASKSTGRGG